MSVSFALLNWRVFFCIYWIIMTTTTLDVVNRCLASMGEAPLNTLLEPHEFRGSAVAKLASVSRSVQSRGWWCNIEEITISPAPVTGNIQLPGDCLKWQSGVRKSDTITRVAPQPWLVQRGSRLYDVRARSYVITEDAVGEITREIPFDDLPVLLSDYIAAETVLKFQSNFDADNGKRQELATEWQQAKLQAVAENTRQQGVNLLNLNSSLQRIKSRVRRLRY